MHPKYRCPRAQAAFRPSKISPKLQAKIDARPYERLRADIVDTLNSPGKQAITNEQSSRTW